jgi:hypothetical protein
MLDPTEHEQSVLERYQAQQHQHQHQQHDLAPADDQGPAPGSAPAHEPGPGPFKRPRHSQHGLTPGLDLSVSGEQRGIDPAILAAAEAAATAAAAAAAASAPGAFRAVDGPATTAALSAAARVAALVAARIVGDAAAPGQLLLQPAQQPSTAALPPLPRPRPPQGLPLAAGAASPRTAFHQYDPRATASVAAAAELRSLAAGAASVPAELAAGRQRCWGTQQGREQQQQQQQVDAEMECEEALPDGEAAAGGSSGAEGAPAAAAASVPGAGLPSAVQQAPPAALAEGAAAAAAVAEPGSMDSLAGGEGEEDPAAAAAPAR